MNITSKRIVVVASAALVFAFIYSFSVRTRPGQLIENHALSAAFRSSGHPLLLTFVSMPSLIVATVVIVAVALFQRRMDAALRAGLTLVLCNVATQVLKYQVLDRPFFGGHLIHNTFPSGHTTAYVSVALAAVLVVPVRWRAIASAVGALISVIVVADLLGYGWHRLSDIVGAATLVLAIMITVLMVVRDTHGEAPPPLLVKPISAAFFVMAAGSLVAATLSSALALITHSHHDLFLLISSLFFATATITGVFWTITRVFEPSSRLAASTLTVR